jgi:putative salt-induced outer membrane protein
MSRYSGFFGFVSPIALLLACSANALAQAPAPAAAPPPPPPRVEGSAEVALVATTGNASTQNFGIAGDLTSRPAPWTLRFKTGYVRNESEDIETAESFMMLLRASRALTPRLSAYGQYDYLRDLFAGTEHRNALEGGLSFLAVDVPVHRLRLDAGLGYANEQRVIGDDISTATASLGAGYRLRLSEGAEFTDDGRVVFSLSNGENWRFDNASAITARLTTILSLRASYTVRYNNDPPPTYKTTDTIAAVALVAKFARQ